jgi:Lar family restriction alleviation protein
MTDKLKPCPFCGGEPELKQDFDDKQISVCCDNETCVTICETFWHDTREEAIKAWNTRADDWQPINEEAKKELRLVRTKSGKMHTAYWDIYEGGTWWIAGTTLSINPTHWKPLPEPPTGEE